MPNTPTFMSLHLRYRLWIAELNNDITILRIFGDYLEELQGKKINAQVKNDSDRLKKDFVQQRMEMDELKNVMHLLKMKLAADARQMSSLSRKTFLEDKHTDLKKRYLAFRKSFDKIKKDFVQFTVTAYTY